MQVVKSNRARGKSGIILYGLYRYYRQVLELSGYLDKRSDYNVSEAEFGRVLRLFNQKAKDALIYDSWVFKLPYRLGTIYIKKKKMAIKLASNGELYKHNLAPDWKRTKDLWAKMYPGLSDEELKKIPNKKIVYYTNEHSYGYKFVIHWQKKYCNIRGHGPYEFKFAKDNRRELANAIRTNPNNTYYE